MATRYNHSLEVPRGVFLATCYRYNEVQDAEVGFFVRECLMDEKVLSGVPNWLADLVTAHGSPGLDVAALLIQKLARKASALEADVALLRPYPDRKPKSQDVLYYK